MRSSSRIGHLVQKMIDLDGHAARPWYRTSLRLAGVVEERGTGPMSRRAAIFRMRGSGVFHIALAERNSQLGGDTWRKARSTETSRARAGPGADHQAIENDRLRPDPPRPQAKASSKIDS